MKHIKSMGNGTLLLRNCIISYPHLFTPRASGKPGRIRPDAPKKYSANFILPADLDEDDKAAIKAVYDEALAYKFPRGKTASFKEPWKDGVSADPRLAGHLMISASSAEDRPPGVYNQKKFRMTAEQQTDIFAGCIVNAIVRCYGFENESSGITFGLNDVQLVRSQGVTRLDNRVTGEDAFDELPDETGAGVAPMPAQAPAQAPAAAPAATAAHPPVGAPAAGVNAAPSPWDAPAAPATQPAVDTSFLG